MLLGCHALGVAVVKPGLVWDGPLSPWPEAALMQRAYHQQAEDAYYVEVVQMHQFPQPKRLHLRKDGGRGMEVAITLSAGCMVFEPLGLCGSQPIPGQPTPAGLAPLTPRYAIQLAAPLADLVVHGSVEQVVLVSRWTRLWSEFPPPGWQGRAPAPAPAPGGIDLSLQALSARSASLASKLQIWAPTLLQHAAGNSAALKTELENEVAWLLALGAPGAQGAVGGCPLKAALCLRRKKKVPPRPFFFTRRLVGICFCFFRVPRDPRLWLPCSTHLTEQLVVFCIDSSQPTHCSTPPKLLIQMHCAMSVVCFCYVLFLFWIFLFFELCWIPQKGLGIRV